MFHREFFGAGYFQPNYWIGGAGASPATELVGRRRRGRRRIVWTAEDGQEHQIVSPPAPLNLEADRAAWAAISARINRIETLRRTLDAATGRDNRIRAMERELAALLEAEDDEDDIETLLLS